MALVKALIYTLDFTRPASFLAQRQTIDAARIHSLLINVRTLSAERLFFGFLMELAAVTGHTRQRHISVKVPLNESEIADLIGLNRFSFSRLKRRLIQDGILYQAGEVFSFRVDPLSLP